MNRISNLFTLPLLAALCLSPAIATGAVQAPQLAGTYRTVYDDIFYGAASYEVTINLVGDTDKGTELSLLRFPFSECSPTQIFVSADGKKVTMPNNQFSVSDDYGDKYYLQYVDPKQEDDFGNYPVTEPEMIWERNPDTGHMSWFGGDFVEGTGWGHFLVVGAKNLGYSCFINRLQFIPLNADFSGTFTRDGKESTYNHGVYASLSEDMLEIYGLMQMDFNQPVGFLLSADSHTLVATDQVLREDEETGVIYLASADGSRTITATATVDQGETIIEFSPFTADSDEIRINAGIVTGKLLLPFDIFEGRNPNLGIQRPETNAPTEWYTITGLRISRPSAPGIYIERKGGKSRTVKL